jgi:hypothetical protein
MRQRIVGCACAIAGTGKAAPAAAATPAVFMNERRSIGILLQRRSARRLSMARSYAQSPRR